MISQTNMKKTMTKEEFQKGLDCSLENESQNTQTVTQKGIQKHWFTIIWLALSFVWGALLVYYYGYKIDDYYKAMPYYGGVDIYPYYYTYFVGIIFSGVIPLLSIILLWRNSPKGFWVLFMSVTINYLIFFIGHSRGLIFNMYRENEIAIVNLIGIGILFVALKIKKNGVNIWNNKSDGFMNIILIYIPVVMLAITGFFVTYIIHTS